jgi:hypothetical protein
MVIPHRGIAQAYSRWMLDSGATLMKSVDNFGDASDEQHFLTQMLMAKAMSQRPIPTVAFLHIRGTAPARITGRGF